MSNFKSIGSDMEVFAKNSKGEHVALCGLIGGSKEAPLQLSKYPQGFMVQEDNVSLEFNIPPTHRKAEFVSFMRTMREESRQIIKRLGFEMSTDSSASFGKDQLIHPKALVFGCEPDYNAWKMEENPKPKADDFSLRTAGGHIHIGTDRDMSEVIKNMDLFVGVPSIIIDNNPSSVIRRKLYGKAGAMRPKIYGAEYRTPSNFWLFDDDLIGWVFDQTLYAANATIDISSDEESITNCINNGDVALAHTLVKKYGINIDYKKGKSVTPTRTLHKDINWGTIAEIGNVITDAHLQHFTTRVVPIPERNNPPPAPNPFLVNLEGAEARLDIPVPNVFTGRGLRGNT